MKRIGCGRIGTEFVDTLMRRPRRPRMARALRTWVGTIVKRKKLRLAAQRVRGPVATALYAWRTTAAASSMMQRVTTFAANRTAQELAAAQRRHAEEARALTARLALVTVTGKLTLAELAHCDEQLRGMEARVRQLSAIAQAPRANTTKLSRQNTGRGTMVSFPGSS